MVRSAQDALEASHRLQTRLAELFRLETEDDRLCAEFLHLMTKRRRLRAAVSRFLPYSCCTWRYNRGLRTKQASALKDGSRQRPCEHISTWHR